MKVHGFLVMASALCVLASCAEEYDVCVYGPNAAGVMAAYAAAGEGANVLLIGPDPVVGGMTTGGLGRTDIGNKQAIIGLAREFYRRLGAHYGKLEQWSFEPHVAQEILEEYASAPGITLKLGSSLRAVRKEGSRIVAIKCRGYRTVRADAFIDCSYEGDLMAQAGVSYVVGRESNETYHETLDGVQMLKGHQFPDGVDPYREPGNPSSGLLWGISSGTLAPQGSGDKLVQAYNYRVCLTDVPENMIPIEKPAGYDPSRYELLLRLIDAQPQCNGADFLNKYFIWSIMPGRKTDINNRGGFSTDMIGCSSTYPEASWKERRRILQEHKDYTLGLLWFWGHDERVPRQMREEILRWGLPKDEYVATGHWTHQLYVREARRMVGEYIATQLDCECRGKVSDGIAFAAYQMDSHNCQRIVVPGPDGRPMVKNEGNVEVKATAPYPISYRSLTPVRSECTNLLVPVCLSASHIAYGSIRMEPVFMATGQAAGIAAAVAAGVVHASSCPSACNEPSVASEMDVQDVPYVYINSRMASSDVTVDVDCGAVAQARGFDEIASGNGRIAPLAAGSSALSCPPSASSLSSPGVWRVERDKRGYGPNIWRLEPGFKGERSLEYTLPEGLNGRYAIYSYRIIKSDVNPVAEFDVRIVGSVPVHHVCDNNLLKGPEVSSEWFPLGEYDFDSASASEPSVVRVSVRDITLPAKEDALLLVKVK